MKTTTTIGKEHGMMTKVGKLLQRWGETGRLGPDADRELGRHLGARC